MSGPLYAELGEGFRESAKRSYQDKRTYEEKLEAASGTDIYKYAQGKKVHRVPAGWRMKNQRRLAKKFGKIMKKFRKGK